MKLYTPNCIEGLTLILNKKPKNIIFSNGNRRHAYKLNETKEGDKYILVLNRLNKDEIVKIKV